MKKKLPLILFCFCTLFLNAQTRYQFDASGKQGFSICGETRSQAIISHIVSNIDIVDSNAKGQDGQTISMEGVYLPNEAGAPDLPSHSIFVAIPNGASVTMNVIKTETEHIHNIDLLPAPTPTANDQHKTAQYIRNKEVYEKDTYYPENPFRISEVMTVRGVDMIKVGIMPFQYNPVTKDLIVYHNVEFQLDYQGGDGTYGEERYMTKEWENILGDMLLNPGMLPKPDYAKRIREHYAKNESGCEYMIIIPDNQDFKMMADTIKQYRMEQGIPTEIITTDEIGGASDTLIRQYIRNAYDTWDMPPAAILIMGGYNEVPSYCMNNHLIYNPYWTDFPYADVNDDHLPDLAFARFTGRNYDDLHTMIMKSIGYETYPPLSSDFYDHPFVAAGYQTDLWNQMTAEIIYGFWEKKLGKRPNKVYGICDPWYDSVGTAWSSRPHTQDIVNLFGPNGTQYIPADLSHLSAPENWQGTTQKIIDNINNGAFLTQFRDHGNNFGLACPQFLQGDCYKLTNTNLTFVMANGCNMGNIKGYGGCLADDMLKHKAGAFGLIATTMVSYQNFQDTYLYGFYDNLWPDFMPNYGTGHESDMLPAFANIGANFFFEQASYLTDSLKEMHHYLYHHFGDAYVSLFSEVPQPLEIEHPNFIESTDRQIIVKAKQGSVISLYADNQIIGYAIATGQDQTIELLNTESDNILITATKTNHLRYSSTIYRRTEGEPLIVLGEHCIDDQIGNNNGLAEAGEECYLNLEFFNYGHSDSDNLEITLSCDSTQAQAIHSHSVIGKLKAGNHTQVKHIFTLYFSENLENGTKVPITLKYKSNGYEKTENFALFVKAPILKTKYDRITNAEGETTFTLQKDETDKVWFKIFNDGDGAAWNIENRLKIFAPYAIYDRLVIIDTIQAHDSAFISFNVAFSDEAPEYNSISYEINTADNASLSGYLPLGNCITDFETSHFNTAAGIWSYANQWEIDDSCSFSGAQSMRSKKCASNDTKKLRCEHEIDVDGIVSFYYKTSESELDIFEITIRNPNCQFYSKTLPCVNTWTKAEVPVHPGLNLLYFIYTKKEADDNQERYAWVDFVELMPVQVMTYYAGDDCFACDSITLDSYANKKCTNVFWRTEGDGTFNDPMLKQPTYIFGSEDLNNGQVTLSMNIIANNNSQLGSDTIIVSVSPDISNIELCQPIGELQPDAFANTEYTYTTTQIPDAEYIWQLEPSMAGTLNNCGNTTEIRWRKTFEGMVSLRVKATNGCSETEFSEIQEIEVTNSSDIAENNQMPINIFPNPAQDHITLTCETIGRQQIDIRIFSIDGKIVFSKQYESNGSEFSTQINTGNLNSGLYHILINTNGNTQGKNIIIR